MQAFPVQVKPVREKPAQEKPFLGKKAPKAGNLGWYMAGRASVLTLCERAQTEAFLAATGVVCGAAVAWYFRTISCRRVKLIYWFVGLFTCVNPEILVSTFLNGTKAARLFERCESESVSPICPQNCPQKGLERVSTMQHSFVHMGQNSFRSMVRNTTKPNKTAL